ncbi:hypothetical protein [Clostridium sp.]|uniref:hypothetical protein n=1 Tax=Clostridium sp. TaxID=1506 RepID=UPI0039968688
MGIVELIGLCSGSLERPVQENLVVICNMTVGGTINKVEDFTNMIQVCVDAEAKKILIPASSVANLYTVPSDLIIKIQPIFYSDPIDVVHKVLRVN